MSEEANYDALLPNFYKPTLDERVAIEAFCRQEHEQIDAIDAEIDKQKAKLEELLNEKKGMVRKCAVAETLVAPVRKLPHDLLRDIFVLCVPRSAAASLWDLPQSPPTHPVDDSPNANEVRATLALVCRLWRSVVDTTPLLWSTIALCSSKWSSNVPSFVELCIQRSESCLLDVSVAMYGQDHLATGSLVSSIRRLFDCMNRIHALSIFVPVGNTYSSSCISTLFPRSKSTELPNLRYFRVMHSSPWEYTGQLSHIMEAGLIDCPRLRRLCVTQYFPDIVRHLTNDALLSLQDLSLMFDSSHPPIPLINIRLQECLNLERLIWIENGYLDTAFGPISTVGFSFPKLKTLHWQPYGASTVLKSLHSPDIEEIHYGCSSRHILIDPLSELLPTIKESLHTLSLFKVDFVDKQLEAFCLTSPSIKHLKFSECEIPASFFCFLMPKHKGTSGCPLLDHLDITSGELCISSLTALLYVKSISPGGPSSWRPFKEVTIAGRPYNVNDDDLVELQSTFPDVVLLNLEEI